MPLESAWDLLFDSPFSDQIGLEKAALKNGNGGGPESETIIELFPAAPPQPRGKKKKKKKKRKNFPTSGKEQAPRAWRKPAKFHPRKARVSKNQ